jgi:diguanylate cyclase (GGDEF)-like protein/PAS domain S-box-containing protein
MGAQGDAAARSSPRRGRERVQRTVAEQRLRESEEHLRIIFEAAPIGMALVGVDGGWLRVNPALCAIVGHSAEDLMATTFQDITHPDDLDKDLDLLHQCLDGSIDGYEMVKRYFHRDGHEVWVELNVAVVRDGRGQPSHFVSQILDITERRAALALVAASEARFEAMVEHGSDLISISDPEGRLRYASPAYRTALGFDPAARIGQPLYDLVHPDDQALVMATGIELVGRPGGTATIEFRFAHEDGSWRWVESTITNRIDDPAVGGFVTNTHDVTERVLAREHLAHQATHDPLTGLPNRTSLDERMVQATAAAARHGELLAALYVDIDHFKRVNDSYGHGMGDLLLIDVAKRLRTAARADDTVVRLGGDEFVIIASVRDEGASADLAARVCTSFAEPFELDALMLSVTASVGVATTGGLTEGTDLLDAADLALYEAKAVGRNGWASYRPHLQAERVGASASSAPGSGARLDAGAELQRIEDRYRAHIAEATQPAVVHVDGLIVAVSPPCLPLIGAKTEDELIGRHVFELVTSGSLSTAQARRVAVESGGWPRPEVLEIMTTAGAAVAVEVTSTPVFWDGSLASQLTLRRVEDRWAEIVRIGTELTRSITQAVVITDLDYKVVAWNDDATHLYGWTLEEVLGQSLADVAMWSATDEELMLAHHELEQAGHWEGTVMQRRRDGSVMAVDAAARVIHDHLGDPIGLVSINSPSVRSGAQDEADAGLIEELRTAIAEGQLAMAFQPIVDEDGHVTKVEALVRWRHPTRGLLLPCAFIPAAERSPVMASLTSEILRQSCDQVARWRREGMPDLELAVNISGRELGDPGLVYRVLAALDASGLPPEALWLEITETALAKDAERPGEALSRISALGVRIALDDFGTGFATLAQLHQFTAHALKIDRLFVDGIGTSSGCDGDAAIVRSILALGRELGLVVIAEGVETEAQRDALLRLGCELFQGYLFARPAFADASPAWLPTLRVQMGSGTQLPWNPRGTRLGRSTRATGPSAGSAAGSTSSSERSTAAS